MTIEVNCCGNCPMCSIDDAEGNICIAPGMVESVDTSDDSPMDCPLRESQMIICFVEKNNILNVFSKKSNSSRSVGWMNCD